MLFYLWFYKDVLFFVFISIVLGIGVFTSVSSGEKTETQKGLTINSILTFLLALGIAINYIVAAVNAEYKDFTGTIANISQGRRHDTVLNSSIEIVNRSNDETVIVQVPSSWVSDYDLKIGDVICVTYWTENWFVKSINDVWPLDELEVNTSESILNKWNE